MYLLKLVNKRPFIFILSFFFHRYHPLQSLQTQREGTEVITTVAKQKFFLGEIHASL